MDRKRRISSGPFVSGNNTLSLNMPDNRGKPSKPLAWHSIACIGWKRSRSLIKKKKDRLNDLDLLQELDHFYRRRSRKVNMW